MFWPSSIRRTFVSLKPRSKTLVRKIEAPGVDDVGAVVRDYYAVSTSDKTKRPRTDSYASILCAIRIRTRTMLPCGFTDRGGNRC